MTRLTDFSKNQLADFIRGQAMPLPDSWHLALGSAADASSFTELTGTAYARLELPRTLTDMAGTQAAASTLASTGTSHATSNNNLLDWGTSGSAWGTAAYVGFFDDATAGECWAWLPVPGGSVVIGSGDPVTIAISALKMTLGVSGGMSDYLANKLIDLMFRGQAYSYPAVAYAGYSTSATTNSSAGTEPAIGGYARVAIASSLAAWSGTQGAGTTDPSSGTSGRISNNAAITFPAPSGNQGTVGWALLKDAATLGNLLFHHALAAAKTIGAGGVAASFEPDKFGISFD
ncbi:MAG: hypothetical protein ABI605_10825 [Rhizobacter sp.]